MLNPFGSIQAATLHPCLVSNCSVIPELPLSWHMTVSSIHPYAQLPGYGFNSSIMLVYSVCCDSNYSINPWDSLQGVVPEVRVTVRRTKAEL